MINILTHGQKLGIDGFGIHSMSTNDGGLSIKNGDPFSTKGVSTNGDAINGCLGNTVKEIKLMDINQHIETVSIERVLYCDGYGVTI
ncbi:unnamed protein product [Rotaria socialis]|uniref:Uncharacterized protein n=2 Tax=Rotaria socialis TaxID=392032 RepID=A0A821V838_9BILA|nr:unnamed protein product [Rotaria socialis]